MTEKQAWQAVKETFYESVLTRPSVDRTVVGNCNHKYGMCFEINTLLDDGLITERTHKRMHGSINAALRGDKSYSSCYIAPCTVYGARKRREFCQKQIDRLSKRS